MNPETQKKAKPPLWTVILAVLILSILIAVVLVRAGKEETTTKDPEEPGKTTGQSLQDESATQEQEVPTTQDAVSSVETVPTEQGTTEPDANTEPSGNTEVGTNTEPTYPADTTPTVGDGEIYEERLAAAMVVGISMMYPDFEFRGIYMASETPLEAHSGSMGAYVLFSSGGQSLALKSVPLDAERQEKGTADLYGPTLGYSTYELVDPQSVNTATMKELQLEDLEDAINQATQTTVIER